ncbi:MAG: phosphoenolpyruvate--protein phosphotransferase [Polyangiaceae bacterium]
MTDPSPPSSPVSDRPAVVLEGIAGSPGLSIGRAVVIDTRRPGVVRRHVGRAAAETELCRFDTAVVAAARGLREVAERLRQGAGVAESSILEAYVLMVQDPTLRQDVERRIVIDQQCAEWALDGAIHEMVDQLQGVDDPYLAERGHDFEFIGDRLLMALSGKTGTTTSPRLDAPGIIVARDLSPAETATFDRGHVLAMATEVGTRTSHTAILARALEIPATVGVRGLLDIVGNGDRLIVDGTRGRVVVSPTDEMVEKAMRRVQRRAVHVRDLLQARDAPTATRCGTRIDLLANIELPGEAEIAMDMGAAGVGLYRTEFLYVDRSEPPSEAEQYETYARVLSVMSPRPVTLRTFDIGGDKFVSAFQMPKDMNPALGLRAIRLALSQPEIFKVQLRAMIRASAHGDLRVMIPMIASYSELVQARELFEEARREVAAAGHEHAANIPLGIMVEVPSAALMADVLAESAEFFSIGTNDLVQYALAVDRTNRELASLATPFDPAILRLVRGVVLAAQARQRPVTVCGAMASDPLAAILLLGLGLRTLSLEASAIPKVKAAISRLDLAEAEAVTARALAARSAADVEGDVSKVFSERFADLLDDE